MAARRIRSLLRRQPHAPPRTRLDTALAPSRAALAAALGVAVIATSGAGGCHATPPPHAARVAPSPPPKDDGTEAHGGSGGLEHAAALEELRVAPLGWRVDRHGSLRLELPDAMRWTRVKFLGVRSLVGFRYGRDHHAIVAGFVVHVADETVPGICGSTFEEWAQPWVDAFEVVIEHDPPRAVPYHGKIADIDSLVARTATLGDHDEYAVAYATYPVWKGACLVLGVAVPARNELDRARAVRDRFATEILPRIVVTATVEPKEMD